MLVFGVVAGPADGSAEWLFGRLPIAWRRAYALAISNLKATHGKRNDVRWIAVYRLPETIVQLVKTREPN